MRRSSFIFLLGTLFLTGCFRGCSSEPLSSDEGTPMPSSAEAEERANAEPEIPLVDAHSSSPASSRESFSTSEASSVATEQEAPLFVVDALQWAQDYRSAFSAIGKLRAIAEGRYSLKEGEKAPDLHALSARLHVDFAALDIPEQSVELRSLAEELDRGLRGIVGKLSEPPTASELEIANTERDALRPKIDALYQGLAAERSTP